MEGDKFVLTKRLHPKWNLEYLSQLMYSETNLSYKIPRWLGTEEELQEILNLEELGMFRWKEVVMNFVANREEREKEWERKQSEPPQPLVEHGKPQLIVTSNPNSERKSNLASKYIVFAAIAVVGAALLTYFVTT